jgi:ribosomal protein S25
VINQSVVSANAKTKKEKKNHQQTSQNPKKMIQETKQVSSSIIFTVTPDIFEARSIVDGIYPFGSIPILN